MTARDTRTSITGPFEDTKRSSSSKAFLRSTSLRWFFDSQIHCLPGNKMLSISIRWSTDFLTSIHIVYTIPILPSCIAFMRIKYYLALYILQHNHRLHATLMGYSTFESSKENPLMMGCAPTQRRFRHTSSQEETPRWWDVPPRRRFDVHLVMRFDDGMCLHLEEAKKTPRWWDVPPLRGGSDFHPSILIEVEPAQKI